MEPEIVWLFDERTYAVLLKMGAYYSTVMYTRGGVDYEIIVENEDFETWAEHEGDDDDEYTED